MRRRLARFLVPFVAVLSLSVLIPSAALAGEGCTTLWTPSGSGHAAVRKTWDSRGDGTYDGEYWGTTYGGNIRVDVYIDGSIETVANRPNQSFTGVYGRARKVYLRVCNGGCSAWW